jgi:TPR repeat protein
MKHVFRALLIFVVIAHTGIRPVHAATVEEALAAHAAGDFMKAFDIALPLAEQGDPQAQYGVALMYQNGQGPDQDVAAAAAWYLKAAEQGHAQSQNSLAWALELGLGVAQDFDAAMIWYRRAAEQGFAPARYNIGTMYLKAHGVDRDVTQAMMWFRQAASGGFPAAQGLVAMGYRDGRGGLPQDKVMAHMWFDVAFGNGETGSEADRDAVAKDLKPAEIKKAKAMAARCRASGYQKCE